MNASFINCSLKVSGLIDILPLIESNAYQFAELIVDRAIENKSGLFLRRDISVTGVEFVPESIAITEEGYRVLLDQPTSLQLVIANAAETGAL